MPLSDLYQIKSNHKRLSWRAVPHSEINQTKKCPPKIYIQRPYMLLCTFFSFEGFPKTGCSFSPNSSIWAMIQCLFYRSHKTQMPYLRFCHSTEKTKFLNYGVQSNKDILCRLKISSRTTVSKGNNFLARYLIFHIAGISQGLGWAMADLERVDINEIKSLI